MKNRYYVALFVLLAAVYLGFSFLIPPNKAILAQYHITESHFRIVTFSVIIPLVAIWFAGLYGSLKLKGYTNLVKKSPEGPGLNLISIGLLVLVFSLPITSVVSAVIAQVAKHHQSWLPTMTIINNYFDILIMGIALVIIANGASKLTALLKKKTNGWEQQIWVAVFIIMSSLYSYFLVDQPIHPELAHRLYYLPNILIILTIAIPYLYFWYRGLNAAYSINTYQKNIKGHIYKGSLSYIAGGIGFIVLGSVFVRFLVTTSTHLSRLTLTPLLFVVYGLIIVTGVGYLLVAYGAKRLRKIEEV